MNSGHGRGNCPVSSAPFLPSEKRRVLLLILLLLRISVIGREGGRGDSVGGGGGFAPLITMIARKVKSAPARLLTLIVLLREQVRCGRYFIKINGRQAPPSLSFLSTCSTYNRDAYILKRLQLARSFKEFRAAGSEVQ